MCSALSAEVVGGCIDGAASGGKESAVGWMSARSGVTSFERNAVLSAFSEGAFSPSMCISASSSMTTSTSAHENNYTFTLSESNAPSSAIS